MVAGQTALVVRPSSELPTRGVSGVSCYNRKEPMDGNEGGQRKTERKVVLLHGRKERGSTHTYTQM